jgi:hypothetical protein
MPAKKKTSSKLTGKAEAGSDQTPGESAYESNLRRNAEAPLRKRKCMQDIGPKPGPPRLATSAELAARGE